MFGCLAFAGDSEHLSSFTLRDQYKEETTFEFPRENVVVFLVSGRRGSELANRWVDPLVTRFGESIAIQGVASLHSLPAFSRGLVRPFIARITQHPVLLDWEGTFPRPEKKGMLIRVVEPCGHLIDLNVGEPSKDEVERVSQSIRKALQTVTCQHSSEMN